MPRMRQTRMQPAGSRASNPMGTGMFRNRGGRSGGGGNRGMGRATGGAGAAFGAYGAGTPGNPYSDFGPGGPPVAQPIGEYAPGAAASALSSGPTTYTAQNDPLLMENVQNLRGRMSADVETAQKQRAKADIGTAAESERKKLATMAERSGGAGAMNEMAGDLADKTMRASAGALTDIGIEGEKRKDALTIGGQGIYAAPGGRNLDERRFQSDVDARLAAQALSRDQFNASNYWQGANYNAGREDTAFNQAAQVARYGRSPYGGRGGLGGGGIGGEAYRYRGSRLF